MHDADTLKIEHETNSAIVCVERIGMRAWDREFARGTPRPLIRSGRGLSPATLASGTGGKWGQE